MVTKLTTNDWPIAMCTNTPWPYPLGVRFEMMLVVNVMDKGARDMADRADAVFVHIQPSLSYGKCQETVASHVSSANSAHDTVY